MSDTFLLPPRARARPRPEDDRPFVVVSHADERYRVICCHCGQRLIDQGLGKVFPQVGDQRDSFRLLMLALETTLADCGHIH